MTILELIDYLEDYFDENGDQEVVVALRQQGETYGLVDSMKQVLIGSELYLALENLE